MEDHTPDLQSTTMTETWKSRRTLVTVSIFIPLLAILLRFWTLDSQIQPTVQEVTFQGPAFDPHTSNDACRAIHTTLPENVHSRNTHGYNESVGSYWSAPAGNQRPSCVVRPRNAEEVSAVVQTLKAMYDGQPATSHNAPLFAVRSGGHAPEAGFANIDDGVLIDMSLINGISVSADQQTVSIGVGARWGEVSTKLDSMGLAVVGGRNSDVGVGGLSLGGEYFD
jgi:hypothetical protein